MKEIQFEQIKEAVSNGLHKACCSLSCSVLNKIKEARSLETSPLAEATFDQIIENAEIANEESLPMCQDTGIITCFVEIGYDVHLNCDLYESINEGVRDAYDRYYFRKSVANPLSRINTKDNTPAIVHVKMVSGDKLKIMLVPKGAGSENMSKLKMLNPTDGKKGIVDFVVSAVKEADGRPCPPIYLGIGIGGNFETAPKMAKEALARTSRSEDKEIAELEELILKEVNKTGIGPMGLGGKTTCLDVFINTYPCHIASMPVAVNIQCHANRHVEVVL
ncbi:MAG: fumarate hydratase [Bacilli bacterium]|nr:fumarate hydratase [Bacilli bacterium]